MTAIESRRRRRTTGALVCGLVGAIMLPSGLVLSANSLLNSTDGESVDASDIVRIPSTPAALLAVVDAGGLLASLQMIALAPGGIGGTVVSIPVNSAALVGEGEIPRRLYDSFLSGGITALTSDVEGLLNVTFTTGVAVTAGDLAPWLAAITNVKVEFDRPIRGVLGGVVTDVLPTGRQSFTAEQVAAALAAIEPNAAEADRLPMLKSLWVGVGASQRNPQIDLTATATGDVAGDTTTTAPTAPTIGMKEFIDRLLAGQVQVWQFAATALPQGDTNPNGLDWYALDRAEIILVTASVVPSSVSSLLASINVQIDTPFNDAAITREAILRFMSLGVNIVLIREITDPPEQATIAAIADVALESEVAGYAPALGAMEIHRQRVPVEGVDLRLTLGIDFENFVRTNPSDGLISASTGMTAGEQ
ncbi:MAG: hypothetical protein FJW44_03695 [Actinobacteria bacterium]|nr:hypothetical protein [Actinomycetota bacterium]